MNRVTYVLTALVLVLIVIWASIAALAFTGLEDVTAENTRTGPPTVMRPVRRVYP